jgi:hypothetical protein
MKDFLVVLLVYVCLLVCFSLSIWLLCTRPSPVVGIAAITFSLALVVAAFVLDDRRFRRKWRL